MEYVGMDTCILSLFSTPISGLYN